MSTKNTTPAVLNAVPHEGGGNICLNCKFWRDKAWINKGWGICDNPRNETKLSGLSVLIREIPDGLRREEIKRELEEGIRYPEDFGCIFFEPLQGS